MAGYAKTAPARLERDPCPLSGTERPDQAPLALEFALPRHELADAAKRFDWASVFEILGQHRGFVNAWRLDGRAYYTPLHQAAYGNAPLDVVDRLIGLGAWRTLPTAQGERPIDIAIRQG